MFVCVCNQIDDKRIQQAIDAGCSDYESVINWCGCEPICRSCQSTVEGMIESS